MSGAVAWEQLSQKPPKGKVQDQVYHYKDTNLATEKAAGKSEQGGRGEGRGSW